MRRARSRLRRFAGLTAPPLVAGLLAVGAAGARDGVSPGIAAPAEATISRDGDQITWVVTRQVPGTDEIRSRVWLWRKQGFASLGALKRLVLGRDEDEAPPYRVVTRPEDDAWAPAFSPDGKWLSFLAARGQDAAAQVWLLPLDAGEAQAATRAPAGVARYAWAPDGSVLYAVPDEEGTRYSLWRRTGPDEDAEPLASAVPGLETFVLAETGEHLVFARSDPEDGESGPDLWRLAVADGSMVRLTRRPGAERSFEWSHDEERIYFLAPRDDTNPSSSLAIFSVLPEGGTVTRHFEDLAANVIELRAARTTNRLFAVLREADEVFLAKLYPNTESVRRLATSDGALRSVTVNGSGERVTFVHESRSAPPELALWKFDNDYFDILTRLNGPLETAAAAPDGARRRGAKGPTDPAPNGESRR